MEKQEILNLLKDKKELCKKRINLPQHVDFKIVGKTLVIHLHEYGLYQNMQYNNAAFEGWAICIKTWLPDLIEKVIINGEIPANKSNKHYQRFLYRLYKFIHNYSAWAFTESYKDELYNAFEVNASQIVMNTPLKSAKSSAEKGEAQLERKYISDHKKSFQTMDQQLPVRLFKNKISEKTSITPSSYLDIWGIQNDTLSIFELKLPNNRNVGIISELMFYVNVLTDVFTHRVSILKDTKERSFNQLYTFYQNGNCKKIKGIFLADDIHPLIKMALQEVLSTLNKGDYGFDIEYSYEKVNTL